ncbi:penicillin amidase [Myxococcaceae bacterium]|nr:penicillin amidase [Myxococcaceae bacterium]
MRPAYWGCLFITAASLAGAGCLGLLRASLPAQEGAHRLPGLAARVEVGFDGHGIPAIAAASRTDAFHALGFVTTRERLFQMDLLRRQMAGRLAEVLGEDLVESDRRHRTLGFEQVAGAILKRLPADQRAVLESYAAGVNQAMDSLPAFPFEFWLLGYRPSAWRPEDSLLVVLAMEEDLGWTGDSERMATVMEAALPQKARDFFSPAMDRYTDRLLNGASHTPPPIPKAELSALLEGATGAYAGLATDGPPPKGSNGWVVGPSKTWDGRAMLANDMHLSLRVPNIWYQAQLGYGDVRLTGLTLPGIPLVVAGSNGAVAWGFTNIEGDFVDLVAVETDPGDAGRYRTPEGFARFGERVETVRVKGGADQTFTVRTTVWGPVLSEPLLGRQVAVRWTALDAEATDLGLLDLDAAHDVAAAQAVFNRAGGPPLNALAADSQGNIGWTYVGKIPKRFGLDGSASRSWADGARGWDGYVPPKALPRVVNPPAGFIVNANQRMLGGGYPYVVGHDFANGHRAYRITERLAAGKNLNERDMLALQLDTRAEFYRFYQRLALSLPAGGQAQEGWRRALESWDGSAERESTGLALLVEFRRLLLDEVVAPYMAPCRSLDAGFRFHKATIDGPLQQLLEEKPPELLPHKERYPDWDALLRELLARAERSVMTGQATEQVGGPPPERLGWGAANRVSIAHPFSAAMPVLGAFLDMPAEPVAGCPHCVRVYAPGQPGQSAHGASERLVVAPGHESNGFLHMPGGQSGHPLSPHYGDQQPAWLEGRSLPFGAGPALHRLELSPAAAAGGLE